MRMASRCRGLAEGCKCLRRADAWPPRLRSTSRRDLEAPSLQPVAFSCQVPDQCANTGARLRRCGISGP